MSSNGRSGSGRTAAIGGMVGAAGDRAAGCHELQTELEYRLLVLVDQLRGRIAAVAAELGLTPQQAILLRHLGRPRTMGEIAEVLACDRSNVTGLVDRLAARGLVERVSDPDDRRVKYLVLTDAGRAHRAGLQERLFVQSPATGGLAPAERHQLLTLLRKLTPDLAEPTGPVGCPEAAPASCPGAATETATARLVLGEGRPRSGARSQRSGSRPWSRQCSGQGPGSTGCATAS